MRSVATVLAAAGAAVALVGCAAGPPTGRTEARSGAVAVPPPATAGSPAAPQTPPPTAPAPVVRVADVLASGLTAPWGLAFLPDGSALVSERDSGTVRHVRPGPAPAAARAPVVGTVTQVVPEGEGGLLGLAVAPGPDPEAVFAYVTTAVDNRVVRLAWDGARLAAQSDVLTGIPRGAIHDGGRLAFGPDGMLYVATGEIGEPQRAQDPADLAGKVLRITPDGRPAPGNPDPTSPVFTLGHRNVQGLAFDERGRLWASEFGAKDVDELNLLVPGGNYGWPVHEGAAGDPAYLDPMAQWSPTALASPSGIAVLGDAVYVASLRGETLWRVPLVGDRSGPPVAVDLGDLGRLRTVATAPDGSLWLVTSNTDGRGTPRPGDDQILRLTVTPA